MNFAQTERLNLDFRPYGSVAELQHFTCKLNEVENALHFVGECPPNLILIKKIYNKNKLTKI